MRSEVQNLKDGQKFLRKDVDDLKKGFNRMEREMRKMKDQMYAVDAKIKQMSHEFVDLRLEIIGRESRQEREIRLLKDAQETIIKALERNQILPIAN